MKVKAQYTGGSIKPIPPDLQKIDVFKKTIKEGDFVALYFEKWSNNRTQNSSNLFHKLRDRYANAVGYDREYAKAELKHLYGVCIPYTSDFRPPERTGRFVEIYEQIEFQISEAEMSKEEHTRLIEGTIDACLQVGADVQDLL